jgi:hypothetical protein
MWVLKCKQMLEDNIMTQKDIHSPIYYLTAWKIRWHKSFMLNFPGDIFFYNYNKSKTKREIKVLQDFFWGKLILSLFELRRLI